MTDIPIDPAARVRAVIAQHAAGGLILPEPHDDADIAAVLAELEQLRQIAADSDSAAGRIAYWLDCWQHFGRDTGLPDSAQYIAGPPPSAEPRAVPADFIAVLKALGAMLATCASQAAELEKLRAELAKHQPGPILRAWRGDNGDIIHGDIGWIRRTIPISGGQHVVANTCSHVGPWRVVEPTTRPEPEPCDGDCDCDCQPGQPCLCPERDCYCGPCPVCDRKENGGDRG